MKKYFISDDELIDIKDWNKRYFETTEYFISSLDKRIQMDLDNLPECSRLDSLERYFEIYETAYLNFKTDSEVSLGDKYNESLQDLAAIFAERVLYPTKRKLEYLKKLILEEDPNRIQIESEVNPSPEQLENEEIKKYNARDHVLAYLIDCIATGVCPPSGQKNALEKIGEERIGPGKGNRFYKVYNEIHREDLKNPDTLIRIGGEDWRSKVLNLSTSPEIVQEYLQSITL